MMVRKITYRQVETFRAVILTGSLTLAAETLRTSQPTVSRVIADFTDAIGFPLFRREGRNVVPTADARALFSEVQKHYLGLHEIELSAERIRLAEGVRLQLTSVTSVALSLLPIAIRHFHGMRPGVPVAIESGNFETILARLAGRQCDLGFAIMAERSAELEARPLICGHAVCVGHRDQPLMQRDFITASDLLGTPLIMVGRQLPGGRIIDSLVSPLELDGSGPFLEVQSGVIACGMAAEGLGIAIIDSLTISGYQDQRLSIRPLTPTIELRYSVLAARGRTDDRILASFQTALDLAAKDLALSNQFVTSLVAERVSSAGTAKT